MIRRFQYVWQHFQSLYWVPENLRIAYGAGESGQVRIEAYTGDFFDRTNPWPQQTCWHQWQGQSLPLLFTSHPPANMLTTRDGTTTIHYDLIAASFYFLSGWQEYHATDRDRFGRFPFQSSLQHKLGIITLPVVNYYFDILKTAIEQALSIQLLPRLNPQAGFSVCLTHDIDNSESAWKAEGRVALQQGRLRDFLQLAIARFRGRDAWFNWQKVAEKVRQAGGVSTFFFLCQNKPYRGTRNADYAVGKKKYQAAIKDLQATGSEIALHGSLEAAVNPALFAGEKACLPAPIRGNRFHYLRFDPQRSPDLLEAAGLAYDSTLGFAEHFGFRHGYCFPFRLYNFRENKPYDFLEIPLILMDTTLHHPHYLHLTAKEVLPVLIPVLNAIRKFQGCFTLLWHNENFTYRKEHNGQQVFDQLMAALNKHQVVYMRGSDLQQHFAQAFPPT